MFIELVDILRCGRPHDDSWLVLSAERMSGRHVVSGTLGCPVCGAAYPVVDGEARLGSADDAGQHPPADPVVPWLDDEAAPMQAAALLSLAELRHPVLLAGEWSTLGEPLAGLAPGLYLVVNPRSPIPPGRTELSVLRAAGWLPLAANKLHGAALDGAAIRAGLLDGTARAVRPGGRLVAPASTPLPPHYSELGRDGAIWVAERQASAHGPPVRLGRAPRAG